MISASILLLWRKNIGKDMHEHTGFLYCGAPTAHKGERGENSTRKDNPFNIVDSAQDGHASIVSFLLEHGAKAEASARDSGRRPIHHLIKHVVQHHTLLTAFDLRVL